MVWFEDQGYEMPNGAPEIERHPSLGDSAAYNDGVVYVSNGWRGSLGDRGVLVHEIWHHQQNLNRPCMDFESEAYRVQARYYATQGVEVPEGWVHQHARISCTNVRLTKK